MGRIKKGILGGFSGKVGTVVGANWKTVSYIRSLPQNMKNPRTISQRRQRGKFTLVIALLKPLNALLRIGWKLYARRQSPFNAATAYTLANAVTGTFPNFQIDYTKLLISCGSLPPAANCKVDEAGSNVSISWENNSGAGTAKATDTALIAVLNPTKGETIIVTAGEKRSTTGGQGTVLLPVNWSGDRVHSYLGFVSENGKEVANSLYLGETSVA